MDCNHGRRAWSLALRLSLLLLACLCLGALALVGWLASRPPHAAAPHAQQAQAALVLEPGARTALGVEEIPALESAAPAPTTESEARAEEVASEGTPDEEPAAATTAARARAPTPADPPPLLCGRVLDAARQPVAGAFVLARPRLEGRVFDEGPRPGLRPKRPGARAPDEPGWPLDAPAWRALALPPRVARTGADGRFELAGLEPGPLRVLVRPPEHARERSAPLEREDLRLCGAGPCDVGDLELGPTRRLSLLVRDEHGPLAVDAHALEREPLLDEAGRPLRVARVSALPAHAPPWTPPAAGRELGLCDERGSLERGIGPEALALVVELPGRGPLRFDGLVPEGNEPLEVELIVPEAYGLRVQVRSRPGTPQAPRDERALHLWPAAYAQIALLGGLAPFGARRIELQAGEELLHVGGLAPGEPYVLRVLSAGSLFHEGDFFSMPVLATGRGEPLALLYHESAALVLEAPARAFTLELEHAVLSARLERSGAQLLVRGLRPGDVHPPRLRLALEGHEERLLTLTGLRGGELRALHPDPPRALEELELRLLAEEDSGPLTNARVVLSLAGTGEHLALAEARSDARGEARIALPPHGPLHMGVWAPGRMPVVLDSPFPLERPLVLRLAAGAEVSARALDGDGRPLVAATVACESFDPRHLAALGPEIARARARTDAAGRVRFRGLAPGKHKVALVRPPELSAPSAWKVIDLGHGERHELVLADDPWGELSLVLSEKRVPLAGAVLELEPLDPRARAGPDGPSPRVRATADALGRVAARHLATGRWQATIRTSRWASPAREVFLVRPGRLELVLEIERARVEGRVLAPDGTPLAGVELRLASSEPLPGPPSRDEVLFPPPAARALARTDAAGRFALEGLEPGSEHLLEARSSAGQAWFELARLFGSAELELVLTPWAQLAVVSEPSDRRRWLWVQHGFGERLLAVLEPGERELRLRVPAGYARAGLCTLDGFGRTLDPGRSRSFEVEPGEQTTLELR